MYGKRTLISTSSVLVFLSVTQVARAITIAPTWKPRELVNASSDYTLHEGSDRALAYDHHGNPGIVTQPPTSVPVYARRTAGIWHTTTLPFLPGGGRYPSLAYDRYERPAISFSDSEGMKYGRFDEVAGWQQETVHVAFTDAYSSLEFDLYGQSAIAYGGTASNTFFYVHDDDGDGSLIDETVEITSAGGGGGTYATLAFDAINRPVIVSQSGSQIWLTVREQAFGWQSILLDTATANSYPSLAINSTTGHPAVAFLDASQHLKYMEYDGDVWTSATVDSTTSNVGLYASLAFDPADGNPAIAYYDAVNSSLKLAWHNGSSWQRQTVDNVGDVGRTPSLAFNDFGDGFPSISYMEDLAGTDNLWFIHDPPAPVPEPQMLALSVVAIMSLWNFRFRSPHNIAGGPRP